MGLTAAIGLFGWGGNGGGQGGSGGYPHSPPGNNVPDVDPGQGINPADNPASSLYGQRGSLFHPGVDYSGRGSVYARYSGYVVYAGNSGNGYGYNVIVQYASDVKTRYNFYSQYAHLALGSCSFTRGDYVNQGTKIGTIYNGTDFANAGYSTGPHLHYGEFNIPPGMSIDANLGNRKYWEPF